MKIILSLFASIVMAAIAFMFHIRMAWYEPFIAFFLNLVVLFAYDKVSSSSKNS